MEIADVYKILMDRGVPTEDVVHHRLAAYERGILAAIRDWQSDPYYAWAWPHARGRVVEALQAAVDHPKVVKGNPEALKAVKALYRVALEAGLPVPQGVQALVRGRGGAR